MAKLPVITTVTSGYFSTTVLNANFEALRDAFEDFVSRNGDTPNTMTADLDLNNNDLLNVKQVNTTTLRVNGEAITSATAAAAPDAVDVVITDAGGYFTGTEAETALQEIGLIVTNRTGSDTDLVTGTAGTDGNLAQWNADGDIVDGPDVLDEDDMVSDSATAVPTQQSVKAYVDGQVGPGLIFISSQDASASASLDFTGFDSSQYDAYLFKVSGLVCNFNTGDLYFRTSTDGGSSYDNGASDYAYTINTRQMTTPPGGTGEFGSAGAAQIVLADNQLSTGDGLNFTLEINGPHLTEETGVYFYGVGRTGGGRIKFEGSGLRLSSADVDAVQFIPSGGNITSGTITMYGYRNS